MQRQSVGNFNNRATDTSVFDAYGTLVGSLNTNANPTTHRDTTGFGGQFGYYTDWDAGDTGGPGGLSRGPLCLTHRYYDPGAGRFLNRDPIGYAGGANLYGFCDGNPVNESDPNGTDPPDGFDPSAYFNNLFSYATPLGVLHSIKNSILNNHNFNLARNAISEASGIAATYNPYSGEDVIGGRILEAAAPMVIRGVDAARAARNARLAKQLLKGHDVEVNSIKDADQVLQKALPNAKKIKGMGPGQQAAGASVFTGKNPSGMYHKDYLVDPATGRIYGHELYNAHGGFKHINVRLPSGDNVIIKIKP